MAMSCKNQRQYNSVSTCVDGWCRIFELFRSSVISVHQKFVFLELRFMKAAAYTSYIRFEKPRNVNRGKTAHDKWDKNLSAAKLCYVWVQKGYWYWDSTNLRKDMCAGWNPSWVSLCRNIRMKSSRPITSRLMSVWLSTVAVLSTLCRRAISCNSFTDWWKDKMKGQKILQLNKTFLL